MVESDRRLCQGSIIHVVDGVLPPKPLVRPRATPDPHRTPSPTLTLTPSIAPPIVDLQSELLTLRGPDVRSSRACSKASLLEAIRGRKDLAEFSRLVQKDPDFVEELQDEKYAHARRSVHPPPPAPPPHTHTHTHKSSHPILSSAGPV